MLLANDPIMSGTLIQLFRHLEHKHIFKKLRKFFSSIFGHQEAVEPLTNDPIMSGTLIESFRHLKHQILSTGYYFTYNSGMIF